jgi:hypothetical protein
MEKQEIVQLLKEQLPALLEESPELERWIERLTAQRYANRQQTESRFDQLMEELRRDREEQSRKWEESKAESERKWAESKAESERKWAEQTEQNRRLWLEVGEQKSRLDRKIGALGARWGIGSERAFRQALAAVLTESFGVEVLNINVFGRPDQIELDIIVRNGTLIIFELKSSTDRSQLYIFSRKIAFYEKRHQRTADRKILVSPFIHPRAQELAQELEIETYGDSTDVELELS